MEKGRQSVHEVISHHEDVAPTVRVGSLKRAGDDSPLGAPGQWFPAEATLEQQ